MDQHVKEKPKRKVIKVQSQDASPASRIESPVTATPSAPPLPAGKRKRVGKRRMPDGGEYRINRVRENRVLGLVREGGPRGGSSNLRGVLG